jgi:hypothetical protein
MKKIALCLHGQPRGLDVAIEYQNKNLIKRDDILVDVFFHTWDYSDAIDGINEKILGLYSPVSYMIEPPLSKEIAQKYNHGHHYLTVPPSSVYSNYCHYHSVYMADLARTRYEQTTGDKYDWVICTRFDIALNIRIDFDGLDSSKIYESDFNAAIYNSNGFRVQNPVLAAGNSENMKKYCSMLNNLDVLVNTAGTIDGHSIFGHNIKMHGLDSSMMPLNMNHPFSPDKYGCSQHSFVRNDVEIFRNLSTKA